MSDEIKADREPCAAWVPLFRAREEEPFAYALNHDTFAYRVELDYEDTPGWSWREVRFDFDQEATPCESPRAGMIAAEDAARCLLSEGLRVLEARP